MPRVFLLLVSNIRKWARHPFVLLGAMRRCVNIRVNRARFERPMSFLSLGTPATPSPAGPPQQMSMSGRNRPELPARSSSLDDSPLKEIHLKIGPPSKIRLNEGIWTLYRMTSSFAITGPCERSVQTIRRQLQDNDMLEFFGGQLESGSLEGPGNRQVWTLTQSVRCPNFGTATEAIRTLSLMNSVVELTSVTSSDGSTDIRSLLILKDHRPSFLARLYGSLVTSTPETGTRY